MHTYLHIEKERVIITYEESRYKHNLYLCIKNCSLNTLMYINVSYLVMRISLRGKKINEIKKQKMNRSTKQSKASLLGSQLIDEKEKKICR